MLKGLFLDDERTPNQVTWLAYPERIDWTVVRNLFEFKRALKSGTQYSLVSLDHDLQDYTFDCATETSKEHTGYDAIKLLCSLSPEKTLCVVAHTQNPVGRDNILNYWRNYKRHG